ncbi:uncharacterized protein BP5553_00757 [Venustampulla echinocandica]|uniref:Peptidase C14 caspase domain-containing protein n=1 Tax=Venustampulla echinocandica TaxID=2656787 RepID=A0A370TZ59_9HELO|nr:uncharacterized protein BP5553_00757 [Venustampulla echinocandica]RDL40778.1 hypothetical protein BP5553_00757 [Venustampulla echinocandica]
MAPVRKLSETLVTPVRRRENKPTAGISNNSRWRVGKNTRRAPGPKKDPNTGRFVSHSNARDKQPHSLQNKLIKMQLQEQEQEKEKQAMSEELARLQLGKQKLQRINEGLKKKLEESHKKLETVESQLSMENEGLKDTVRQQHEDLKDYVDRFGKWTQDENNVKKLCKNQHVFPYTKVKVLMAIWKSNDREAFTKGMVEGLGRVFKDNYNYEVNYFKIPDQDSSTALSKWVSDFIDGSPETLLIFYYTGHGGIYSKGGDTYSSWSGTTTSPTIAASPIQRLFEETESDALLLYESCHSGTGRTSASATVRGVTEVIGSCGFEGYSYDSKNNFTHALIEYLKTASKNAVPLSVSEIHHAVLSKLKSRSRPQTKHITTPVHCKLSYETKGDIIIHPLDLTSYPKRNAQEVAFDTEGGFDHPEWHKLVSEAPVEASEVFFSQPSLARDDASMFEEDECYQSLVDSMVGDPEAMDVDAEKILEVGMMSQATDNSTPTMATKRKAEQDPDSDMRYHLRRRL